MAHLLEYATGLNKFDLLRKYAFAGTPMVDTRARFLRPTRFGDDVVVESMATEFRRSSFDITHRLLKDGELAVECFETRVWVVRDPADPDRIRAQAVPEEFVALFRLAAPAAS
jgi:4-hydroxybenzoyl-CoA thioesterase